jgi:pimeloyl-ACP methyl ester carboxylesterase
MRVWSLSRDWGRIARVDVYLARHGSGEPVLLLLHGLGATGEVWDGLVASLADRWPGTVLVPDLPGHGRSAPLPRYTFGAMTAAVAAALPAGPVAVLGHSLGGVLGLTLASGWFGVPVSAVCGLGIKVSWSPEELAKAAELAARPAKTFGTREEAMARALKVAGLHGLVPSLESGVVAADGGWRLALDAGAFGVGAPDMAGLLAACRGSVVLASGESDRMSPPAELPAGAVSLNGLGHNAHVEDPGALWPLVSRLG